MIRMADNGNGEYHRIHEDCSTTPECWECTAMYDPDDTKFTIEFTSPTGCPTCEQAAAILEAVAKALREHGGTENDSL